MSAPQKVYINGRFLCHKTTGVQKYALGLSKALQENQHNIIVITPRGIVDSKDLNIIKTGWGKGFLWEQLWLPIYLWLQSSPLLINLCNTAPLLYRKQIVTIHDLAFLKNKDWFSPSFIKWYKFLLPRLCKKALTIFTVSDFIKKELGKVFSVPSQKIMVVPNGIPEMVFDEQKLNPFPYLLLTGIYNPRKNASFVIDLLPELKKHYFHIVGVGADDDIYGKVILNDDEQLHVLKYVKESHYYTLMKHADALVFPSEYEGFGIPVLEALMLGTPVIVPDLPEYRDSFGELPLYYKAGDKDSFLNVLKKIKNYSPSSKELNFLKNKYNFTLSAASVSEWIKHYFTGL
ncbi:MAG: glycosyltransferase family 1 protein [Bacteroidales bacterium]|nr:glycosyltransferase family 1 protein [Bacteroidales bacterium]